MGQSLKKKSKAKFLNLLQNHNVWGGAKDKCEEYPNF